MGDFISGISGAIGSAAEWTGGALSSFIVFFGDISEGIAEIGHDIYEAGSSIVGETSKEAARTAAGLAKEAVRGQAAQVPIWIWIGGGILLGITMGFIPNPFK